MKSALARNPKPLSPAQASKATRATKRLADRQRRQEIADHCWEWMQIWGGGHSIDKLLCRPSLAKKMCKVVRRKFKDAQEHEICESLLAARKQGKFASRPTPRGGDQERK